MESAVQIPRSVRTEWLLAKDNNFRVYSHPRKRGYVAIEADRKYKVHGMECILNLIKQGELLDKPWAKESTYESTKDVVTVTIKSSNPLYYVAEALDNFQVCYPRSEEIFNIGHMECISLINETRDYKALCNIPVADGATIPYYPCTVHLVEIKEEVFVPVTEKSISRGMGRYYLDMDNYFLLMNPLGLDAFDIKGMMIALPMNKIYENMSKGGLQIIKEVPGTRESDEYDKILIERHYNHSIH